MVENYKSYRTALIACIIIFVCYLGGILAATINTSKKGLTIDSEREELDEEENLFIPLYTGFITFIVIATITLSQFKKKGTSSYYDMESNDKSEIERRIGIHKNNYKDHLKNIGDGKDPISNPEKLDEKFFRKMPYYDSLVIVCLGLLLTSFFGIFLFKRTLFCKRQCYAGKSNRCCSTHLMCPATDNSNKVDLTADLELNLNFNSFRTNNQIITIDRGETIHPFIIDVKRGSSTGMTNILHSDTEMYGCCCSTLDSGACGVSIYIPQNISEKDSTSGNITNIFNNCVGNLTSGLCSSINAPNHGTSPKFYISSDNDINPNGIIIGYKKGTDTFINSKAGISTNQPDAIVQQLTTNQTSFNLLSKNPNQKVNLFTDFYNRHIDVKERINSQEINNDIKNNNNFSEKLVCIDPGFRYIPCSNVKALTPQDPNYGLSARYWNYREGTKTRQYFPACFNDTGVNSQINKSNKDNPNFETLASRVFAPNAKDFNTGIKGNYTDFIVGGAALTNGTTLTTYEYNKTKGKYKPTHVSSSNNDGKNSLKGTHNTSYTDSATFCFRDTTNLTHYNPFNTSNGNNPLNNNIASNTKTSDTSNPDYYRTHAPNSFRTATSANSKTTEFHMGFNHEPPKEGFFSNLTK